MGLRVYVQFEGDFDYTEITEYVYYDSVRFNTALCNNKFKAIQDSVRLRTIYDKELNEKFFSAKDWLPAYITNDQEEPKMYGYDSKVYGYPNHAYGFLGVGTVFTGAIFPSQKDVLKDYPDEGVYFEIIDNNYLLEKDVPKFSIPEFINDTWYVYNPSNIDYSFVHQLLLMAGLEVWQMEPMETVIDALAPIVIEEDKHTYYKIISDILYEHHYVHYFDNEGIFRIYNWKHDSIMIIDNINEDIIKDLKGIRRSRNILEYDGYELEYMPIDYKNNALVYRENLDVDGKLLLSNQTVPINGETKEIYQGYSSNWLADKNSSIIFSSNHKLDLTKDDGINVIIEELEVDKARIVLKNETLSDRRLYQFDIRADVIFENGRETLTLPADTEKKEKYKCKYVRTYDGAEKLANALYNNKLKYGKHKYEFDTDEKLLLGSAYKLINRDYIVDILIIEKDWNAYEGIYTYSAIGVGDAVKQADDVVTDIGSADTSYEQAYDPTIRLIKSPEQIVTTATGHLRTTDIVITAIVKDLKEEPNWYCTDGNLELVEIDDGVYNPYQVILDCSTVEGNNTTITCEITEGGRTYAEQVNIDKIVVGSSQPIYLGALDFVPPESYETPDRPIIVGDHFLFIGDYLGDNPENDPNREAETPEELEELDLARTIDPPISAVGEYIPGRMYFWNGIRWAEDRTAEHLGHAYADAINIARNTGKWLYVAVLIAQLGMFQDLIAGRVISAKYDRDELGRLTQGFVIDGNKGTLEAYGMKAWNIEAYGTFISDGFRTLEGGNPVTIGTHNVNKTIYKYSDFVDELPKGDDVLGKSINGTFEGYTFNRALREPTNGMILARHNRIDKTISAGDVYYFTALYPSKYFTDNFRARANGYYKGRMSDRFHGKQGNNEQSSLSTSYNTEFTKKLSDGENYFRIRHSSYAWWGSQPSWAEHTVRTLDKLNNFSAILLDTKNHSTTDTRNSINSHKEISYNINSYLYASEHQFSINEITHNSIRDYCSGEEFYNLFDDIPIGGDGFASGKIRFAEPGKIPQDYDILRIAKTSTSITFTVNAGKKITIDRFIDTTGIGAYSHLEIRNEIVYAPVESGIEVKNIMPMGFAESYPNEGIFPSAIGGQTKDGKPIRFAELWVDEVKANRVDAVEMRNLLPFNFVDNVDNLTPLELHFFIPTNTSRITNININIRGAKYRGFVTHAVEAEPYMVLTYPTLGNTTGSGGSHSHNYTRASSLQNAGSHSHSVGEDWTGNLSTSIDGSHGHTFGLTTDTTGSGGGHTHSYDAPDGIGGGEHGHAVNLGIKEGTLPAGVELYCDNGSGYGSVIALGSSEVLANNLDLTDEFSGTGWKKIKITSTQAGRIFASLIADVQMLM